uniref:Uncharacterized protein n=1 Tax=Anguilla anguilla TaxID=7936 RepID=A0A0E9UQ30_ANGAN
MRKSSRTFHPSSKSKCLFLGFQIHY